MKPARKRSLRPTQRANSAASDVTPTEIAYDEVIGLDQYAADILAAARAVYGELTIEIDHNPGLRRAIEIIEERVQWIRDAAVALRMGPLGVGMEATKPKEAAAE